jgi:hypothetical protein
VADRLVGRIWVPLDESEGVVKTQNSPAVFFSTASLSEWWRTEALKPPSIAQGGKGVVVPGCPACMEGINTMSQFLDHLADDAMPALIERLSEAKTEDVSTMEE